MSDCSQIPSQIEKYMRTYRLATEEDEIDYLIYRISSSTNKFIRNGFETDSATAAEFLRWKLMRYQTHHDDKIDDDEEFVVKIMKGSEKTGQPYLVILPDGTKHNLQSIMKNELNNLEIYQGESPEFPTPNA